MAGLSRRQFLTHAAALAAALGFSLEDLGPVFAVDPVPAEGPSTLLQTVLQGAVQKGSYRILTIVLALLSWVASLVCGFFVTGPLGTFLAWTFAGIALAVTVALWRALHRPAS